MSDIKHIVIPLTVSFPSIGEDYFTDGWSKDIVIDMDFMREHYSLLKEIEKNIDNEYRDDPITPFGLIKTLHCGKESYNAEIKYIDELVIPLCYHRLDLSNGKPEFWLHTSQIVSINFLFKLVEEAEDLPEWNITNPYSVRCGDTLVTTLVEEAAYNGKDLSDNGHWRTLYNQIELIQNIGWVPAGMKKLVQHSHGAPIASETFKNIMEEAKLNSKEYWGMHRVLSRLYKKLEQRELIN